MSSTAFYTNCPMPVYVDHHFGIENNMMHDHIATLESLLSFPNVIKNPHLQREMSNSNWLPLSKLFAFTRMAFFGINTLEKMQAIVDAAMDSPYTNLELDSTRTLVRPSWAKWSQITFNVKVGPWSLGKMSEAERPMQAKKMVQRALDHVKFSEQVRQEKEEVEIVMFRMEKDGTFTASFNVPGIPSLIAPFMNAYSENYIEVSVTKVIESMLFVPELKKRGDFCHHADAFNVQKYADQTYNWNSSIRFPHQMCPQTYTPHIPHIPPYMPCTPYTPHIPHIPPHMPYMQYPPSQLSQPSVASKTSQPHHVRTSFPKLVMSFFDWFVSFIRKGLSSFLDVS